MPRRKRNDTPGTIHHVIQRGNNRNYIYENTRDKKEFLSLLSTALTTHDALLLQYALMDNHYHLLIKVGSVPLSSIIWFLNRNYSLYYNSRYNRTGTIYGDRYKSYLVTETHKLFSIIRYIVQNPVKAGLAATPSAYRWSGHTEVCTGNIYIIARTTLLSLFSPDPSLALQRYIQCTEHEKWTPQVGFATIIDKREETRERLSCLLDQILSERNIEHLRAMVVSGAKSPLSRELRTQFVHAAVTDGHALRDIASFLHVSHETVRRISKQEGR
ncbi:transposase [uncultured Sphaerochaeta sp.]|uniref:transposase n=1 Tax=uncultured Sphaerochaeta sp. TaxID=886478 RepID=UPI0029CA7C4C|nr:transposase [uncultured Sphaerochaeta sp.]